MTTLSASFVTCAKVGIKSRCSGCRLHFFRYSKRFAERGPVLEPPIRPGAVAICDDGLPPRYWDRLFSQQVGEGTHLIRQSDRSECLYFIESGQVTARLEFEGGRALRLRRMGAGTIVGQVGMFLGGSLRLLWSLSVIALFITCRLRLSAGSAQRIRNSPWPFTSSWSDCLPSD
jgi:hypothetical protein